MIFFPGKSNEKCLELVNLCSSPTHNAIIVHNPSNFALHRLRIGISSGRMIFLKEEISQIYKIERLHYF